MKNKYRIERDNLGRYYVSKKEGFFCQWKEQYVVHNIGGVMMGRQRACWYAEKTLNYII